MDPLTQKKKKDGVNIKKKVAVVCKVLLTERYRHTDNTIHVYTAWYLESKGSVLLRTSMIIPDSIQFVIYVATQQ